MISVIIASHERVEAVINSLTIMKQHNVFKDIDSRVYIIFDGTNINSVDKDKIIKNNPCRHQPVILETKKHVGQNVARNIGLNIARDDNPDFILFIDDDATIINNLEFKKILTLFNKYKNAGAIGLTSIVERTGEDQYYKNYKKYNEIFPVIYPCLAATIIRANIVFKYERFFFPEDIQYGSDEWALSLRVRQAGYQVYATNLAKCYHRFVQAGRVKNIRGKLQYAHGYIWALFPPKFGFFLLLLRMASIILKPNFEKDHIVEKSIGLILGYANGLKNKDEVFNKYIKKINWKDVIFLYKEAYKTRNKLISYLIW